LLRPPGDCSVWDRPNGAICYAVYLRMFANQSGLVYPDFDIETDWDDQIFLEGVDENKSGVSFGGQWYPLQEILNPRIENNQMLSRGRIIFGWLLAKGLRPIPAEYGDFAIVPFNLTLRDQLSGDIIQSVPGQLSVSRCRNRYVSLRTGLYGGGKPIEVSPVEESRRRCVQEPKPQFAEPLSADQRSQEIMRYAALLREEKIFDASFAKVEGQKAKALHKQKQGSGIGPAGSVSCGVDAVESCREMEEKSIRELNLRPETQAMFEDMIRRATGKSEEPWQTSRRTAFRAPRRFTVLAYAEQLYERHRLSAGGLRVLRAARRSRRHALTSSFDNLASTSTWARSRPTQTFSLSGTKRANGDPFLRSTKVTF
jgi:hypothetical protein